MTPAPSSAGALFRLAAKRKNELEVTTADGFRLHMADAMIDYNGEPCEFIVNAKALATVAATIKRTPYGLAEPVTIRVSEPPPYDPKAAIGRSYTQPGGPVTFQIGCDTAVTTRTVGGTFPNYSQLVPTPEHTARMIIADATQALAQVSPCASESGIIRIGAGANVLDFSANNDTRKASAACDATLAHYADAGAPMKIAFNLRYLRDTLACFAAGADSTVVLGTTSPSQQGLFTRDGDTWKIVVMPMFVQWDTLEVKPTA